MSGKTKYTEWYRLIQPDEEDFFDINHFNQNAQILDTALGEIERKIQTVPQNFSQSLNISAAWTGNAAPYTQTIAVDGMSAGMDVIADAVLSGTTAEKLSQIEAMGMISEVVTGNGTVTLYCYQSKPEIAFTMRLKEV